MSEFRSLRLAVPGMSCASCVRRIETALSELPEVAAARVNLATQTVEADIVSDGATEAVINRLSDVGYPARVETIRGNVSNLSCASCVRRLETALKATPGVLDARVNFASKTAQIDYSAGRGHR